MESNFVSHSMGGVQFLMYLWQASQPGATAIRGAGRQGSGCSFELQAAMGRRKGSSPKQQRKGRQRDIQYEKITPNRAIGTRADRHTRMCHQDYGPEEASAKAFPCAGAYLLSHRMASLFCRLCSDQTRTYSLSTSLPYLRTRRRSLWR